MRIWHLNYPSWTSINRSSWAGSNADTNHIPGRNTSRTWRNHISKCPFSTESWNKLVHASSRKKTLSDENKPAVPFNVVLKVGGQWIFCSIFCAQLLLTLSQPVSFFLFFRPTLVGSSPFQRDYQCSKSRPPPGNNDSDILHLQLPTVVHTTDETLFVKEILERYQHSGEKEGRPLPPSLQIFLNFASPIELTFIPTEKNWIWSQDRHKLWCSNEVVAKIIPRSDSMHDLDYCEGPIVPFRCDLPTHVCVIDPIWNLIYSTRHGILLDLDQDWLHIEVIWAGNGWTTWRKAEHEEEKKKEVIEHRFD